MLYILKKHLEDSIRDLGLDESAQQVRDGLIDKTLDGGELFKDENVFVLFIQVNCFKVCQLVVEDSLSTHRGTRHERAEGWSCSYGLCLAPAIGADCRLVCISRMHRFPTLHISPNGLPPPCLMPHPTGVAHFCRLVHEAQ